MLEPLLINWFGMLQGMENFQSEVGTICCFRTAGSTTQAALEMKSSTHYGNPYGQLGCLQKSKHFFGVPVMNPCQQRMDFTEGKWCHTLTVKTVVPKRRMDYMSSSLAGFWPNPETKSLNSQSFVKPSSPLTALWLDKFWKLFQTSYSRSLE